MNRLSAIIGQYRMILAADGIVSKEDLIEMLKADEEINSNVDYEKLAKQILEDIENCKEYTIPNNRKESNENRMRLYKQGLSDKEIAENEKVCPMTIYYWRNVRGLSANPTESQTQQIEKDKLRLELYEQGLTDTEIATRCNEKASTIKGWRERNDLLHNSKVKKRSGKQKVVNERRMKLLEKGYDAQQIADVERVSRDAIYKWMNRRMKVEQVK